MNMFRRWLIRNILFASFSIIMLGLGICLLFLGNQDPIATAVLVIVGGITLLQAIARWQQLFAGHTVLRKQFTMNLRGGAIELEMPAGRYEVWILCETPLAQYHGQITIEDGDHNIETKTVERREPTTGRGRSPFIPIVWKPAASAKFDGQEFVMKFDLVPSFASSSLGVPNMQDEFHLVELVVRKIKIS